MNLMHWTSPKGGKVYAGFHIELEGIKKFTCQKGLSNVTLTLRLRFFCRLLFQLMFSLSLASLSIFIVKSFFNHAYALVFISLWSCAMQARIPDRGNGDFFTILILMKNTGECNASPLSHTAMPSLFRCQLPDTQAICASCLRKLLSCLHLSSDFSFPLL